MRVEVDQSGKIEWTQKPTVVAYSNNNREGKSLKISAVEKRRLFASTKLLRPSWSPTATYVYIFSILIYLLIKNDVKNNNFIVDKEYSGYEPVIKDRILSLLSKSLSKLPTDLIGFGNIGKGSLAHDLAISVFREEKPPTKSIKAKDILAEIPPEPQKKTGPSREVKLG